MIIDYDYLLQVEKRDKAMTAILCEVLDSVTVLV